jgi:hypothetical protein
MKNENYFSPSYQSNAIFYPKDNDTFKRDINPIVIYNINNYI